MSDQKNILAMAFLEKQPEAAADILMQYEPEDVISFISDIPKSQIAKAFTHLLPHYTASLCLGLKADTSAEVLSELDNNQIAAILKHLDTNYRGSILKHLPPKIRAACNSMLRFSKDRVGAWMTPQILSISHRQTVREALQIIEIGDQGAHTDYIYVVNHEMHIEGRVHYTRLLKADPEQLVTSFIEQKFRTLPGNMKIERAASHEDWEHYDVMPVLNREKQFTGILRHVDLRKGLNYLETHTDIRREETKPVATDKKISFGSMYIHTLLTLFSTITNIIETDSRS